MYTIEQNKPFSKSQIWKLQQDYFEDAGIAAWQHGQVPHYITSNPVVGKTYAELVLALLRDLAIKGQNTETVYVLELGAGHGRLCYHFFKHFETYYINSALTLPPLCYVLSDFTEASLAFWETHPRLQPYFEKGQLDVALFDAKCDSTIQLKHAGIIIDRQQLQQPLVVIANYFFDSIPQELVYIRGGKAAQVLLSISSGLDPEKAEPAQLIHDLALEYSYSDMREPAYPQAPLLDRLLQRYRQELSATHLLFPDTGIRCLHRLKSLSKAGLVLLSADKGEHHLSNLDHRDAPQLARHGSFSLSVNYHALKWYCESEEGLALFPRHRHASLDLGCLLMLNEAASYLETQQAYNRFVQDFGPDDYFSLKKLVEKKFGALSYADILAVTRLSGYDARLFQQMLPDLSEHIDTLSDDERWTLFLAVPRIWDTYFPLREAEDLAMHLGHLLLHLGFYEEAILYYEKSIVIYRKTEQVLYNMALCHCLLQDLNTASLLVTELLELNPGHEAVVELMETFKLRGDVTASY